MDTGELFPVISSSGVGEREEFPGDFGKYMHRELNWARLEDDDGEPHVTGWVFWSRKDDKLNRPSVSDCVSEDLNLIPDSGPKVKDKIRLALGRIILHPRCGRSLVQYWAAATTIEGRTLLTTQNQPYALGKTGRSTWGLCEYRIQSMEYKFYGDIGESGEEELGLPGRVFLHKLPESAPDVQYYSLKEYPQRDDASHCQVRASWALPVFEHSSQICVGVLELVSTIDAIKDWYDKSFLRNLHDVFQELGLQSIDCCKHYQMKYTDEDKDVTSAFDELALVLESLYKVHKLPLALAWVPCSACDALLLGQLSSKGAEYLGAFKANDNHLFDFLVASTGCHLRNGQVVERVLSSPNMLYCSDITQFSIAEYPLVPFARQCKLSGWFTICLHSSYTGDDVYILELFLPASSTDNENTLTTVRTILGTMKANSKTLKLASGKELGEVLSIEVLYFQNGEKLQYVQTIQASLELLKNGGMTLQVGHLDQPLLDAINDGRDDIRTKEGGPGATSSKGGTTKIQERKQKKSGVRFDISLDDVLRFSALSRTNAARELKVSVSTLKRVCRKYGIPRWPPHDTNKEAYAIALPNVEDIVHLDSPEEPSLMEFDDAINGAQDLREDDSGPFITHLEKESLATFKDLQQHFDCKSGDAAKSHGVSAERNNLDVTCSKEATIKTQERALGKAGVRIEIPLEDILQYSNKRLDFAASELKVSVSTLKRICRNYGIERWPPRNIKRVCHFQPSPVENKGQTPPPSNLTSPSVAHKTQAFQDEDMVTIKAKYENNTFKFQLSLSSRLVELQQELAKRLNLDAGTYYVKYKDEEDDLIAIACDEDLQSCLHISRSLGNTSTVVLLELKDA